MDPVCFGEKRRSERETLLRQPCRGELPAYISTPLTGPLCTSQRRCRPSHFGKKLPICPTSLRDRDSKNSRRGAPGFIPGQIAGRRILEVDLGDLVSARVQHAERASAVGAKSTLATRSADTPHVGCASLFPGASEWEDPTCRPSVELVVPVRPTVWPTGFLDRELNQF
jgi:hypothetical protein